MEEREVSAFARKSLSLQDEMTKHGGICPSSHTIARLLETMFLIAVGSQNRDLVP